MDRITAIEAVARNIGDLITDSIPASAAASHVDVARLVQSVTDQLKGRDFYVYGGAGAGQDRIVTGFVPANNRLTFEEVFTTIPSVNSTFLLFNSFTKDDYDNALDRMVGIAETKFLEEKVATMQLVATQFEYAVPSGFEYISTLRLVPSGSSDYELDDYVDRVFEFAPHLWRIEANPLGSFVITFDPRKITLDAFDADWVRVVGQAKPAVSPTDNATIPDDLEEYLIAGASALLSLRKIDEKLEWKTKFYQWRDTTKSLEESIFTYRRGKRVG